MNAIIVASEKCWSGSRRKDAGDLKRSELNELVGNWTCLSAPGGKIGNFI